MRVVFPASTPSRVGLLKPVVLHMGRFRRPLEEQRPGTLLNTPPRTGRPYKGVIRSQMSLGHRFANHGGRPRGWLGSYPSWGGGSSEGRVSVSARAVQPPPFGVHRDAGGAFLRAPGKTLTRASLSGRLSPSPQRTPIEKLGRTDPWLGKLGNFSRPRPLSPPSVRERLFSPEGVPTALGSRTPRTSRLSVRKLRLRHGRGRGLQAAAVAPPNRLSTAPQVGGWGGAGLRRVRLRAPAFRRGAWLARGPAQARRLRPPHLPISSAWRRRCVRRGLPRVLRAGAAHWSLVLEAAAAAAAAAPAAPPPPPVAAAPRARAPAPAPLSTTPRAPILHRRGEHEAPLPEAGE